MQMIGCDLHARQQTLAILDTHSGVLEGASSSTTATTSASFTTRWKARCASASKRPARCSGSWN
jgi:hypothetical protein